MKKPFFTLFVILSAMLLAAVSPEFEFDKQGRFLVHGYQFYVDILVMHNRAQGSGNYFTPGPVSVKDGETSFTSRIVIPEECPPGTLATTCSIRNGRARLEQKIHFDTPAKFRAICYRSSFPASDMAGRTILIDEKELLVRRDPVSGSRNVGLFAGPVQKRVSLPVNGGLIHIFGKFWLSIQEYRGINLNRLDVMLSFTPGAGTIQDATGRFEFEFEPFAGQPVDLRSVVNMGFRDEVAGDGKGGWTDQGSNDLRLLPVGRKLFGGIPFDIVDPLRNNGKSCLMLRGRERTYFPKSATVECKSRGRYLHLLHASAFHPGQPPRYGVILVTYANGSTQRIPVTENHVGDWWNATRLPEADVVWSAETDRARLGLYHTMFSLRNQPLASLKFESADGAVWGIVAATLTNMPGSLRQKGPVVDRSGEKWRKIDYPLEPIRGSIMDFSGRLDAPAGKYGPVVVRNGRFEFEKKPGRQARFYGTNLTGDTTTMPREWSDRIADRLAMFGFNLVRLHHHDGETVIGGDARRLHKEKLDRMDYLIAALAKRGIYTTTDIYVSRKFPAGVIPEHPEPLKNYEDYKVLFLLYDSVCDEFLHYMREILSHTNPYTGFQWKDDPAIVSISLLNENSCTTQWNRNPKLAKVFLERFQQFCRERNLQAEGGSANPAFRDFLDGLYRKRLEQIRAELRKIGCNKPVTDQNFQRGTFLALQREACDYVDIHLYHDHPVRVGEKMRRFLQRSAIPLGVEVPGACFPERLIDKPFAISEIEYCTANDFRAEHAALLGTYAALQNWDMVIQFTYAHRFGDLNNGALVSAFDISNDPMRSIGHRFAAAQFLDGSFKAAPKTAVIGLSPRPLPALSAGFEPVLRRLGLILRLGTKVGTELRRDQLPADTVALLTNRYNAPVNRTGLLEFTGEDNLLKKLAAAGVFPAKCYDAKQGIFRSLTGQLEVRTRQKVFRGISDKCEVFVAPIGAELQGNYLSLRRNDARCVVGIINPAGEDLKEAKRLLLMHLTNISAEGRTFVDDSRTTLSDWGTRELLAARGQTEITLSLPGDWKVFAVDAAGKRLAEIPVRKRNDKTVFPVSVFNKFGQTMAYELTRN